LITMSSLLAPAHNRARQSAFRVLMVEPAYFAYNPEAGESNEMANKLDILKLTLERVRFSFRWYYILIFRRLESWPLKSSIA